MVSSKEARMKAGRKPRKDVDRYPSGEIVKDQQGERPEQGRSVVVMQRMKFHGALNDDDAKDPWYGFPLGRMRKWAVNAASDSEGLSDLQYRAIMEYITAHHRYCLLYGIPSPHPKSLEIAGRRGKSTAEAPGDDEVMEARRRYNGARSAILEYSVEWMRLIDRCAMDDESLGRKDLGGIRCGANILVRHFGLSRL
jgi:hypothetical protein